MEKDIIQMNLILKKFALTVSTLRVDYLNHLKKISIY